MISTCEPYRQSEQKRCEKFCGSKEQKAPGLAKKGETGCSLGAGGGGSGWKRMRADGKTRSLKQNAPNNHAIQEKRKPEKTQCFRRFCGRGRRSWLVCRLGCCSPVGSSTDRGGSRDRFAAERHWHALPLRHTVLQWMWKHYTGTGGGAGLPGSPGQVTKERCWFGAAGNFGGQNKRKI